MRTAWRVPLSIRMETEEFDGLVAMYHDQGLIPVKMRSFHDAVQLTAGLPDLRLSPDHGTAFDIAGRNRANPGSIKAALNLAITLARKRSPNPCP